MHAALATSSSILLPPASVRLAAIQGGLRRPRLRRSANRKARPPPAALPIVCSWPRSSEEYASALIVHNFKPLSECPGLGHASVAVTEPYLRCPWGRTRGNGLRGGAVDACRRGFPYLAPAHKHAARVRAVLVGRFLVDSSSEANIPFVLSSSLQSLVNRSSLADA